jgi:hypothetical protein
MRLTRVCFADPLTRAWDLSTALGLRVDVDRTLAERALTIWRRFITDDLRDAGVFGPVVDTSPATSSIDRLAAFAGRRPSS